MAMKASYRTPVALNRSLLDQELQLSDTVRLPIKVILFWFCGAMFIFFIIMHTPIKDASAGFIIGVLIWMVGLLFFLGRYTKTKEMTIARLPALWNFIQKSSRYVSTRSTNKPRQMYWLVGIKDIDETGRIEFADGTVGRGYRVVGTASALNFEQTTNEILKRNDNYWRKVDTNVQHIFVTTKEPQRIYSQLANLDRRNMALKHRDPGLIRIMENQKYLLEKEVGQARNSVHQYLILKAGSDESLRIGVNMLNGEVYSSTLMFKQCIALSYRDVVDLLITIYRNDQITRNVSRK